MLLSCNKTEQINTKEPANKSIEKSTKIPLDEILMENGSLKKLQEDHLPYFLMEKVHPA